MDAAPDRKLTAIFSADVAGYSRLMEADEAGTFARLKACRRAIADEIDRHRGRLVSTAGDSVLAEFPSVVNAVDCAARIQRDLAERNGALPEARRMLFRIGVNLGDVMIDGADLFGDGVNIAARLQQLAEPGGILISGSVFEQVRNKLSLGFDYLGAQTVKNISEAVPAYRVMLGAAEAPLGSAGLSNRSTEPAEAPSVPEARGAPQGPQPRSQRTRRQRLARRAAFASVAIAALFAINMMTWHGYPWFMWPTLVIAIAFLLRSVWVAWS